MSESKEPTDEARELLIRVNNSLLLLNTSVCKMCESFEAHRTSATRPLSLSAMLLLFISGALVGYIGANAHLTSTAEGRSPAHAAFNEARAHH